MDTTTIDEPTVVQHITDTFADVETTTEFGYLFFFYGADHKHPFATIASEDNEQDQISNLDRPGVYRLNIGVGRQTFQSLFGTHDVDVTAYDFTALDEIMPHPEYAAQRFVCVLNPSDTTFETVQDLLEEAYEVAVQRNSKRQP